MIDKHKITNSAASGFNDCVIGLDRDGVINQNVEGYITDPTLLKPIPGSLESIALLRARGYRIVIITNQGGIEKGIMTAEQVDAVHQALLQMLGDAGCGSIDAIYYSESSNKNDYYAKPNVGMFKRCEEEHPFIRFSRGFYVGDKISDLRAAIRIGARPVLVRTGHGLETEKLINKYTYRDIKKKTYLFNDLADFVNQL